ncbi:MAG: hypothetical protein JXR70_02375 [Spirochaetales bacterium]|nr:hypothetical protein [Spirochaetales bacterium]
MSKMVSPQEVKKKARAKYLAFCRAFLKKEDFFPLEISCNKGKLTDPFVERKKSIELLLSRSLEKRGFGYSIDWETVNSKKYGLQSRIKRIYFSQESHFLRFIEKTADFKRFVCNVELIRQSLPELEEWFEKNISLLETDPRHWPNLLLVCHWFMNNPEPDIYLREIPLEIHSKFVEENRKILRSLLDFLLPPNRIEWAESDFSKRYKLKYDEPLIRCRYIENTTEVDVSKPLGIFCNKELQGQRVFIIENKTNFLSFPLLSDSVVMWGSGFRAGILKKVQWLCNKSLFYWGDLDPPGFGILSLVRSIFPQTRSMLMDFQCYESFQQFAVPLPGVSMTGLPQYLNPHEKKMCQYLLDHPQKGRLEQEHVSQDYLLAYLKQNKLL